MGDRLQEKQDRHRWTNQETNHFLEVAMDLAENGEFKKGKYAEVVLGRSMQKWLRKALAMSLMRM